MGKEKMTHLDDLLPTKGTRAMKSLIVVPPNFIVPISTEDDGMP